VSKCNRSLAFIVGAALGVTVVGIAAIMYARSRAEEGPIRSVEEALGEARDKIREIEQQIERQRRKL